MKTALIPQNVDCLFYLKNANLQLTTDQALQPNAGYYENPYAQPFLKFKITDIIAVRSTGGASVACTGGVYTSASKAGTAVVGVAQSWLGVSGADKVQRATLAAACDTDIFSLPAAAPALYLSLTTGSTAAVTADIYVYGYIVS